MAIDKDLLSYDGTNWVPRHLSDVNSDLEVNLLKDIVTAGLADKFILVWDASVSKWKVSSAGFLASEVGNETDLIELKDVNTGNKLNGQSLMWDSVTQSWINRFVTVNELTGFGIEPGTNSGDILVWNSVSGLWEATPDHPDANLYSLTEKIVGRWIHDEYLYRKVITFKQVGIAGVPQVILINSSRGFPVDANLFTRMEVFHTAASQGMKYSVNGEVPVKLNSTNLQIDFMPSQQKTQITIIFEYTKTTDPAVTTTTSTTTTTTSTTSTTTLPGTTTTTTSTTTTIAPPSIIATDLNVSDPETTGILSAIITNIPVGAIVEWEMLLGPVPPDPTVVSQTNSGDIYSLSLSGLVPGTYAYEVRVKYPGASINLADAIEFIYVTGVTTTTTSTTTTTTTLPPDSNNNTLVFSSSAWNAATVQSVFGFAPMNYKKIGNTVSFVTTIPYVLNTSAFIGMVNIVSVNLHVANVTGTKFTGASNLNSVTFSDATYLSNDAFKNCTDLETLTMPYLEGLGTSVFQNCTSLNNVDLRTVENIPHHTFYGASSLTDVIGDNVTVIGDHAFEESSITGELFTIFPELISVGNYSFMNSSGVTLVEYYGANSLSSIGQFSFKGCSTLIGVHLDNISYIPEEAFSNCIGLTEVTFEDIIVVDNNAFTNCESLLDVTLPIADTISDESFMGCTSLGTITLPSALVLGSRVFKDCTSLTTVNLPLLENLGPDMGDNDVFDGCVLGTLVVNVPTPIKPDLDLDGIQRIWTFHFNQLFQNN